MRSYLPILVVIITLLFSCDKGEDWRAKRRIINQTSHAVRLEVFGDDIRFSYSIHPNDTLEIEGTCSCCVPRICHMDWSALEYGTIIFDGTLRLEYVGKPLNCDEKAINVDPDDQCHGYTREQEDGWQVYTYIITEDDYESAEPFQ